MRLVLKSAPTPGDTTTAAATTPNGTAQSIDVATERGSEKRAPKGGKKNGGRGRNNPKKGKDGGDAGEGDGGNKADSKPHPRRGSGHVWRSEVRLAWTGSYEQRADRPGWLPRMLRHARDDWHGFMNCDRDMASHWQSVVPIDNKQAEQDASTRKTTSSSHEVVELF
ncbi:unnamed protein product [Phytophthora lilii]|uniref:Unnamed protein product n=1 Tax=Phytophthora lilii TaxID=2077276 RepID=A0A9W6TUE5_9STRA|nr:unnamed protein product [Phytophthora lilii]